MDKTDIPIDVPQGATVRYMYAAFNALPNGKTLEDVPKHYKWMFESPIQGPGIEVNIAAIVHDFNVVRKEARVNTVGIAGLLIDQIFGVYIPVDVVMRRQLVITLPFEDLE